MNEESIVVRVAEGKVEVAIEKRVDGQADEKDLARRAANAYLEATSHVNKSQEREDNG